MTGITICDDSGDELVDATEVAGRLGLRNSRAVLDLRVHRLGFPAPVGRQGRSLLWSWAQVERWSVDAGYAFAGAVVGASMP